MSFADAEQGTLEVLHLDAELCIVNKPSGLAVHPGWAPEKDTALSRAAKLTGRYVYPVHRLDRATSGVLVFALSAESARNMQLQMQGVPHAAPPANADTSSQALTGAPGAPLSQLNWDGVSRMQKLYLALVRGIAPDCGVVDHALAKSKQHEKREARSAFQRLGCFERYSLVRVRPFTGRLHQIRRHMKFISHPLIGDVNYGRSEHNRLFRERFELQRLALHAGQLRFFHPQTSELVVVRAPLPADLAGPLAKLGLLQAAQQGIDSEWPQDTTGWPVLSDLTALERASCGVRDQQLNPASKDHKISPPAADEDELEGELGLE